MKDFKTFIFMVAAPVMASYFFIGIVISSIPSILRTIADDYLRGQRACAFLLIALLTIFTPFLVDAYISVTFYFQIYMYELFGIDMPYGIAETILCFVMSVFILNSLYIVYKTKPKEDNND